jgi:hydrogenase-4 component F
MLAYSSLEHVGLICVAVGLNSLLTVFGALLHMGYHALTKPVLFFAAGNIHQHYHTLDFRRLGGGLARTMPATALVLGLAAGPSADFRPWPVCERTDGDCRGFTRTRLGSVSSS